MHVFVIYFASNLHLFCKYFACVVHVICIYAVSILDVLCMYFASVVVSTLHAPRGQTPTRNQFPQLEYVCPRQEKPTCPTKGCNYFREEYTMPSPTNILLCKSKNLRCVFDKSCLLLKTHRHWW